MPQAAAPTAESALAPDHIDATLNYIIDDGSKVFTIVASPGGTDTRSGGTADPHRVTMHNGRVMPVISCGARRLPLRAATTPRCRASSTRTKSAGSTIRRWKRW